MLDAYFSLTTSSPQFFTNEEAPLRIITDPDQIMAYQAYRRLQLDAQGLPESWAEIGIVLDDPYVVMIRDLVEFPDSERKHAGEKLRGYIRLINRADIEGGQGVVVLPQMDSKVLLLHQFRHATRAWHLEVPRGFGEPGVSAEDNAREEIKQEIGGEISGDLINLGTMHNNTGMEGHTIRLFFARLASVGEPEVAEAIDYFKWVSVDEFEGLIRDGTVTDGFTIVAYTRAKLRGLI